MIDIVHLSQNTNLVLLCELIYKGQGTGLWLNYTLIVINGQMQREVGNGKLDTIYSDAMCVC